MTQFYTAIPVLETEHYQLRGMTVGDTSELFAFHKNKEIMKYITPDPVKTEAEMREEVLGQLKRFSDQKEIPWVIINKSNGDLIGSFSFYKLHMFHKKADMGVVLCGDYQGRGVMTEVLEKVLSFGFGELGLNRIVGDICW
ncbi:GNAT family N-acetyltransferase [Virgibacillus indicus]|uniref:GNAT family N-acetyltransferase n=1 Tax=Virgibacillus indicus TaxID=2024554 RepID=UPI001F0B531C|nr:GNAT family N-acetyltransferase [Virgibacillus indicus]